MQSIYIIGSLRNPEIISLTNDLTALGLDVFSDWHACHPDNDEEWRKYEQARGRNFEGALNGYMAKHIFEFDKFHLDRTDGAVLLTPAGKSAHLELGYTLGRGKPGFVLFDQEPERWDVMYQFATAIFFDRQKFLDHIKELHQFDPSGPIYPDQAVVRCLKAPEGYGWRCTREAGHRGPCAAIPRARA